MFLLFCPMNTEIMTHFAKDATHEVNSEFNFPRLGTTRYGNPTRTTSLRPSLWGELWTKLWTSQS